MAFEVEAVIATWKRGFSVVVHQHSNSVNLDHLSLADVVEGLLECWASERAAQVVATTIRHERAR